MLGADHPRCSVARLGSLESRRFGAFIMRYRIELVLAFPLVALVMALYLSLAFRPDSAVQRSEVLYRAPTLMAAVIGCTAGLAILLFVNLPVLHRIFTPTIPWSGS
jgi:hypothetical protein